VKASEQAIELGKKLVSLKEECKQDIDGYVRRGVDFPSLMLSGGLVSALTFYLSKSNVDEVKKYYRYWSGGDEAHEGLCNDVGKGVVGVTLLVTASSVIRSKELWCRSLRDVGR